jgi:hypothetical protein
MRTSALAAGLAVIGLAIVQGRPAVAGPASPPPDETALSPDERAIVHVIAGCKIDPGPAYCAPFLPLLAQLSAPSTPAATSVVVDKTLARFTAARAQDQAASQDPALFASGHVPGADGAPTPPKGGGANVSLAATSDTKTASIAVSFDLSKGPGDATHSLTVTAATPVGQGQDYQNVATLDGLTKSTNVGFQYNYMHVATKTHHLALNTPYYQASCKSLLDQLALADPAIKPKINQDWYQPYACHAYDVESVVEGDHDLPAGVADRLDAAAKALDQQDVPTLTSLWMLSANGKVGYEQHSFFDGVSLAKGEADRTPFQLGLAGTYVFGGGAMSATLSYAYQKAYKDGGASGQTRTLCPPTGHPVLKCVTGYINAPTEADKDLFTVDLRYISPPGLFPIPFGVNPTVSYDAHSGVYGVQFPVYILANKSKSLTGGVRYDWTSDKHESVAGVFVASAFCILPGYSGCPSGAAAAAGQ